MTRKHIQTICETWLHQMYGEIPVAYKLHTTALTEAVKPLVDNLWIAYKQEQVIGKPQDGDIASGGLGDKVYEKLRPGKANR